MEAWITFWEWLLIAVAAVFTVVAAVVAVGGFFDVKALFTHIDEQHHQETDPHETHPPHDDSGDREDPS